jgi:hypothetical protein|tara:strand:+ start:347 stop:1354 length:1008 start_codon:yes stop_codon:yes gene_type:complete
MTTINTQVLSADNTYSINELSQACIKANQKINLQNFDVLPHSDNQTTKPINPDQFDNLMIDGSYNRAVEDFNYPKLYENLVRRGGFSYPSASGIKIFYRPVDGKYYIVDGVHRSTFLAVKGYPIYANIHKHKEGLSLPQCRKIEAQVYMDLGYHTYKINPDQNLKAAVIGGEEWAIEFGKLLKTMGLYVKSVGDTTSKDRTRLTGYQTLQDTIVKYDNGKDCAIRAVQYIKDEINGVENLNSLFASGLTVLLSTETDLKEKYILSAIDKSFGNKGFLKQTLHGKAKETLALRFGHLYNNSIRQRKGNGSIYLEGLCDIFNIDTSILKSDHFITAN